MIDITEAIEARQTQLTQLQSEIETLQRAASVVGGGRGYSTPRSVPLLSFLPTRCAADRQSPRHARRMESTVALGASSQDAGRPTEANQGHLAWDKYALLQQIGVIPMST